MKAGKKKIFKDFITREGLKSTRQRDVILNSFLASPRHMSIDELYWKVRSRHPGIGYATVCRTMKLFSQSGIARELNFGDGQKRYENISAGQHHDHLICTICGEIVEFENEAIEKLQQSVAETHGFLIESHKLDLYGLCVRCQKGVR